MLPPEAYFGVIPMVCLKERGGCHINTNLTNLHLPVKYQLVPIFLAHLCICMVGSYASLSVCLSLDKNSWVRVKGHIGQDQIRIPSKGRWAHNNVKMLHFFLNYLNDRVLTFNPASGLRGPA